MYGYRCEFCDGIVREHLIAREAFKHARGFVILEHVPVGICEKCGNRYYHASLLKRVEEIATGKQSPVRQELVPVGCLPSAPARPTADAAMRE
jgi:YgiT-type zinc finger domain-containing protein